MSDGRPDWDDQFAETPEETALRWAQIKRKRREAGRCVICNRLPAVCECKRAPLPEGGSADNGGEDA